MGQVPERKSRFYFTIGRTVYEHDDIEAAGVTAVGWWALFQAVACDNDGWFEERIAKRRLASYGDVTGAIRHLYDLGLIAPVSVDRVGWWRIVGWSEYQKYPKTNAERQQDFRDRKKEGESA